MFAILFENHKKWTEEQYLERISTEETFTTPILVKGTFALQEYRRFLQAFYHVVYSSHHQQEASELFGRYPQLHHQYQSLVTTRQITLEDFWIRYYYKCDPQRMVEYAKHHKSDPLLISSGAPTDSTHSTETMDSGDSFTRSLSRSNSRDLDGAKPVIVKKTDDEWDTDKSTDDEDNDGQEQQQQNASTRQLQSPRRRPRQVVQRSQSSSVLEGVARVIMKGPNNNNANNNNSRSMTTPRNQPKRTLSTALIAKGSPTSVAEMFQAMIPSPREAIKKRLSALPAPPHARRNSQQPQPSWEHVKNLLDPKKW